MNRSHPAFWSISATEMLEKLQTAKEGLTSVEARQRLARYGANLLKPQKRSDVLTLLLAQFKSPIILILFFYMIQSMPLLFFPSSSIDSNPVHYCLDVDFPLHPPGSDLWIQPALNVVPSANRDNCILLHYRSGNGEKSFLQEGNILKSKYKREFPLTITSSSNRIGSWMPKDFLYSKPPDRQQAVERYFLYALPAVVIQKGSLSNFRLSFAGILHLIHQYA